MDKELQQKILKQLKLSLPFYKSINGARKIFWINNKSFHSSEHFVQKFIRFSCETILFSCENFLHSLLN